MPSRYEIPTHLENGWLRRLVVWRTILLCTLNKSRHSISGNRRCRPGQKSFDTASCAAQIFKNGIWITQLPWHISKNAGCYIIADKVVVWLEYIDNIIIYSQNAEEHILHVRTLLLLSHQAGLTLNIKKCHFFREKIDYRGHVIQQRKLKLANHNIDTVRDLNPPCHVSKLKSLLGLCNIYWWFVQNFVCLAAPPNKNLRNRKQRGSTPICRKSMTH